MARAKRSYGRGILRKDELPIDQGIRNLHGTANDFVTQSTRLPNMVSISIFSLPA